MKNFTVPVRIVIVIKIYNTANVNFNPIQNIFLLIFFKKIDFQSISLYFALMLYATRSIALHRLLMERQSSHRGQSCFSERL